MSYGLEEPPQAAIIWISAIQHVGVCAIFMVYPLIIARRAGLTEAQTINLLQLGFLTLAVATSLQALLRGPIGSRPLAPSIFTGVSGSATRADWRAGDHASCRDGCGNAVHRRLHHDQRCADHFNSLLDGRRTLVVGMGMMAFFVVTVYPAAFTGAPRWAQPLVTSPLVLATLVALVLNLLFRIGIRRKVELTIDAERRLHRTQRRYLGRAPGRGQPGGIRGPADDRGRRFCL